MVPLRSRCSASLESASERFTVAPCVSPFLQARQAKYQNNGNEIGHGGTMTPRSRTPPVRRRLGGHSQANFTANTAAITKTPGEQSLHRPASTLLVT